MLSNITVNFNLCHSIFVFEPKKLSRTKSMTVGLFVLPDLKLKQNTINSTGTCFQMVLCTVEEIPAGDPHKASVGWNQEIET